MIRDAWHCCWCGQPFVIADFARDHEKICTARPQEAK